MAVKKRDKTWGVYMLRCSDNSIYTGITTDIYRRLDQHNGRRAGGAKYTSTRNPVTLVYVMYYEGRGSASIEENRIKRLSRKSKESMIREWGEGWAKGWAEISDKS